MSELGMRPSGGLFYSVSDGGKTTRVDQAFSESISAGLFSLAVSQVLSVSPSLRYWRKVAGHYLNLRCQQGQTAVCGPLPAPNESQLQEFVQAAPPMRGAEYLNLEALTRLWGELDHWLCTQVAEHYQGQLADFLQAQAPHWHQVGRVCFHLAENPQDPDYPFAFMATYAAQVAGDGRLRFQPLAQALERYSGAKNKAALIQLLSPIELAAQHSAPLRGWLASGELYQPQAWSAGEAFEFIQQAPAYEQSGIIVRLPDWWKKRAKPQLAVTIGDNKSSNLGTDNLLDFNVHAVMHGEKLSAQDLAALLASEQRLIFFKGQWVEVDREKLSQALHHWQQVERDVAQGGISFSQGMRLLAGVPAHMGSAQTLLDEQPWAFVDAGKGLKTLLQQLRAPENIKRSTPGRALKATLRPYQVTGVNWLSKLSQLGLGACLADDMGLGKTIQVIALLLIQAKKNTAQASLLVLPASLLNNWKSELERFAPSLNCHFVHPAFLTPEQMADADACAGKHLIITSYGMLTRQPWLLAQTWQLVILDEAQAIKNPNTKQTRGVKQLKARARIALTGTPLENRLSDLWSLFDFLCPGLLGNAAAFKKYVKSLEASDSDNPYAGLRSLISPYILRRLKSDKTLIADLPEKTELHAYCGLSKRQAVLYGKSVKELQQALTKNAEIDGAEGIKRRGLVLSYLLRFKQICNHPSQWLGDEEYKPQASGKFTRLAELAEEIAARQEKVLIFTQFRAMTGVLADFLESIFARPGLVLHGGTSIAKRKEAVEAFQREDGPPFFVLSIKAGGTGLNLTAASHVIHFDRWWNPAVENQATDRAYRIGQKRNVLVHKFVCQGTVEEKIDGLIADKTALSDALLGDASAGEKSLTELNDDELIELVALDLQRISA